MPFKVTYSLFICRTTCINESPSLKGVVVCICTQDVKLSKTGARIVVFKYNFFFLVTLNNQTKSILSKKKKKVAKFFQRQPQKLMVLRIAGSNVACADLDYCYGCSCFFFFISLLNTTMAIG